MWKGCVWTQESNLGIRSTNPDCIANYSFPQVEYTKSIMLGGDPCSKRGQVSSSPKINRGLTSSFVGSCHD